MFRGHSITVLSAITFVLVFIFAGQSAQAEWGISIQGELSTPRYAYYGDRLTSEYRRGYQLDDWVERGDSSVTDSPVFADGIRLAAWATRYEEDYEYAMASAIYFFEIPRNARSIRVKISYDGEADRSDLNGDIAGRVWLKRARLGNDYEEYYPSEGRYEDADEPLYGDTFVLRAKKHLEIIRLSADDHVVDDIMELHVVAEGRQRVDVKYIEVETYSYLPKVRVITRYYRDYVWRPWYDYTYWYFYTGPVYHFSDYYYVRYTYPRYHHHYVDIRKRYNSYLRFYYIKRPHRHVRWVDVVRVPRGTRRTWDRNRLNRWTSDHEDARKSYRIVSTKTRRPDDLRKSRTRVRSVLANRSRPSPAATRARSGRTVTAPSKQRSTSAQTRGSGVTEMKRRSETSGSQSERQRSTTPALRTQTDRSRSSERPSVRTETRASTRTRRDDTSSSVRSRSSTSGQSSRESSVRQSPTRSTSREQEQKTRRENVRSRTPESSRSREVKKAPSRSESQKRTPPKKKVETKKDDDEDEDEKKSKSSSSTQRSTSTRSTSSSSNSKRRGR